MHDCCLHLYLSIEILISVPMSAYQICSLCFCLCVCIFFVMLYSCIIFLWCEKKTTHTKQIRNIRIDFNWTIEKCSIVSFYWFMIELYSSECTFCFYVKCNWNWLSWDFFFYWNGVLFKQNIDIFRVAPFSLCLSSLLVRSLSLFEYTCISSLE